MTPLRRLSLAFAWAVTIKPAIALTAAFSDPGCLAGASKDGLPWLAPSIACLLLLGTGWRLWPSEDVLWQLVSWESLIGASAFATSPLSRSLGWRWPAWEVLPLFCIGAVLLGASWAALNSRYGRYRVLGAMLPVVIAMAVVAPYVPATLRWPMGLIWAAYGSLGAALVMIAWVYKPE